MMLPGYRHIATVFIWILFGILLISGFREANAIRRFHGVSLRYNTPICGQTALRARQYSIENMEQNAFWPTFWHQCRAELSAGTATTDASVISFSGEASLVWPAYYIAGSAPGVIDARGIAVSEALAHRLWGSTDIIGMPVYVNNQPTRFSSQLNFVCNNTPRIIRGVFEGETELALLPFHLEDTSQSWTAVELAGGTPHPTRGHADSFAATSGLGRPDYVLMGGATALARFMSIFPILIPAVYGLVLLVAFIKKHYPTASTPIFFAGFILFAILLPILLNALPPWIIPTRWSDFSFWSSLLQQANGSLREFIHINPMLRDVELKMRLLRQVGIFVLSVSLGIVVCAFRKEQFTRA